MFSLALICQILLVFFVSTCVVLEILGIGSKYYPEAEQLDAEVEHPDDHHVSFPDVTKALVVVELSVEKWYRNEVDEGHGVLRQVENDVELAQFEHDSKSFLEVIEFNQVLLEEFSVIPRHPKHKSQSCAVHKQHQQAENETEKVPNSNLLPDSCLSFLVFIIVVSYVDLMRAYLSIYRHLWHLNFYLIHHLL